MAETKTYEGGCHCGAVRYQVKAALERVIECNCSICSKTGALLAFVPAERFTLLSGGDEVTDYQFGKKHIHHTFCPTCGIRSYAHGKGQDGATMFAINVRCLDGVDPGSLAVDKYDGKSL